MSLNSRLSSLLLACGLLFTSVDDVSAQQVLTPRQISFQGVISEGDKVPADGPQIMTFALYSSQFSTQPVWTEEQRVTVRGGLFNVYLGEKNPLPENFSREYWVGVSIKGGGEFTRVKMTSVPYAFQAEKAQSADALSGGTVTRINGLQGNIDLRGGDGLEVRTNGDGGLVVGLSDDAKNEGILNDGTEWLLAGNTNATSNSWLGTANNNPLVVKTNNTERMRVLATGNVGIGETNPSMRLTVARQLMLTNTGGAPELRLAAASGTNFTAFKTGTQGASITYTLPLSGGTTGSALTTDDNDNLTWTNLNEWKTIGNSNLSGTSFIGSTNAQPFILKTNNVERLRVTATGAIGINETSPVEKLEVGGNIVVSPISSTTGELRIIEEFGSSGNNYTALRSQAQSANITYKLPAAQGAAGQVLTNDGSGELYWAPAGLSASSGWSLDGNPAVSGDFLGTTNTSPLEFRVNGVTRFYFVSSGAIQRNSSGNVRGNEAIDLQTSRTSPGQVAGGNFSVISGGRSNQANGQSAVISGGESNVASGTGAVVGGGTSNSASNNGATVGGGNNNISSGLRSGVFSGNSNSASAQTALVVGGSSNAASGVSSVVVGGDNNTGSGGQTFVGSGTDNTASGLKSLVVGGNTNTAQAQTSVVVGGFNNLASGVSSAIVGGENNVASQPRAFIGTGSSNTASGQNAAVIAGSGNSASGSSSFIAAGVDNTTAGDNSFIGTGRENTVNNGGLNSAIVTGFSNLITSNHAFIGGGFDNTVGAEKSVIGGGQLNIIDQVGTGGRVSFIGGGHRNQMYGDTSVIGGGSRNNINLSSYYNFIGGGMLNSILANDSSFIGGGANNTISVESDGSFVGGGIDNIVTQNSRVGSIVGGRSNTITTNSIYGSIGGGHLNTVNNADSATIGGGAFNRIIDDGDASTIGGGQNNTITTTSRASTIGGGRANTVTTNVNYSGIASGFTNTIQTTSDFGFIGGGNTNTITNSDSATIGGGAMNLITTDGDASTIGGGQNNTVTTNSRASVIGGGRANTVTTNTNYGGIGSGYSNTIQTDADFNYIGGGNTNTITSSDSATIGGGAMNLITTDGDASTIGGGNNNSINNNSRSSTIGGGHTNAIATGTFSATIGGGNTNDIGDNANYTMIGGGLNNNIADGGTNSSILGGTLNDIGTTTGATSATIGGGNDNNIADGSTNSAIVGGTLNDLGTTTGVTNAFIGGGNDNNVADGANYGSIVGGASNNINGGTYNLIGAGQSNTITTGNHNTLLGGNNNTVTAGNYNAILGGQGNTVVSGNHSAVLGGTNNSVTGNLSFALGTGNTAANNAFAIGNGSTADANEFYAKYSAGLVMEGAGTANGNFTATFINPSDGNGIAIQVNNATPGIANDFVQFRDAAGGVVGRIEGQTIAQLDALGTDSEHTDYLEMLDYLIADAEGARDDAAWALTQSILNGVISVADMIQQGVEAAGDASCAAGTLGLCSGSAAASAAGVVVKIAQVAMLAADIIGTGVQLANAIQGVKDANQVKCNYINYMHANIGVTYESGSADYAEWLPKMDLKEKFIASDIVALKGGKITKNTANADQLMVISTKPIVLGNTPNVGKAKDYEKVAFMGQVPVRVLGKVNLGDYILPSGGNNGLGIAVAPHAMKTSDYKKIVGTAWSTGEREDVNVINVAVGLNTNSLSAVIEKQAAEIRDLQLAASYTQEQLRNNNEQMIAINSTLSRLIPGYREEMKKANVNVKNTAPVSKTETPSYSQIEPQMNLNIPDLTKATPENKKVMVAHVEDMKNKQDYVLKTYARFTDESAANINSDVPKTFFNDATMEEAFKQAESDLVKSGMDLSTNPFFSKIKSNPAYKEIAMKRIQGELNKAVYDKLLSSTK